MNTAVAASTRELLAELRGLCARIPIPQPSWHPYVSQITACRDDFEQALALATEHPTTLDLLAALIEDEAELIFDPGASPRLTRAWERLEELPTPSGQHPDLDDIIPALEAHRLLLVALSHTTAA